MSYILSIDQGTSSSRSIIFDAGMQSVASASEEFKQYFPQPGWVEHNPEDLFASVVSTARAVISESGIAPHKIVGIGITNQRETTLLWDRQTGKPVAPAIVWQDRRTAERCEALRKRGLENQISSQTGLLLDPYFSSTKLAWLLDHVEGARARAENGELCFGTVDSWLVWRLTGGKAHVTDMTNAARTMLFDIHRLEWSSDICAALNIPMAVLPEVRSCQSEFGVTEASLFGAEIPILGIAGDQQAATIGQACFEPGMVKSTYGTGCFALLNTGTEPVRSQSRLLTTLAYHLDGKACYALEGSIFIAGAAIQWLRDGLKIIHSAEESGKLAENADKAQDVIFVPALTGLGAPFWQPLARGAIFGITRNTGPEEIALAALQSVGFQTRDLIEAMQRDYSGKIAQLRIDGGMTASDIAMQFLSDTLGSEVDRPDNLETTALGAAWLAGNAAGIYPDQAEFGTKWKRQKQFQPQISEAERELSYEKWRNAVRAVIEEGKGRAGSGD